MLFLDTIIGTKLASFRHFMQADQEVIKGPTRLLDPVAKVYSVNRFIQLSDYVEAHGLH